MVKLNRNDLRDRWADDVAKWLDRKAEKKADYKCPRCGMEITNFEECDYSQYYDEIICGNCVFDEILRDSVGKKQVDISRWYIKTKVMFSYMFS